MHRAKWEYLYVEHYGEKTHPSINGHIQNEMGSSIWETLNLLGQEGWEVVDFALTKGIYFHIILKRMI